MADEDQLNLDLGLEEPAKVEPEIKKEPDDGIAALKEQIRLAKEEAAKSEAKARSAMQEAAKAKSEVDDTNLHLINNAIDRFKSDADILKVSYAAALESGNYLQAAEIQLEMTRNSQGLLQLENGRDAMKNKPVVKQSKDEEIERFLDSLSERSSTWLRAHPEYIKNERLNQKMLLAHAVALDDGLVVDTDEYFESIENRLGIRKKLKVEDDEGQDVVLSEASKEEKRRDATPPSAPVSRTPPGGKPNTVRLSQDEREIADSLGQSYETYAKNKVELKREGRIN